MRPFTSPPLNLLERAGIVALLAGAVVLGMTTVKRTAFSVQKRGDFAVYARAAWAVRTGGDIREVQSRQGWHYVYPPTLAVLMVPLASPPPPEPPDALTLPLGASVAIWYAINLSLLALAVHLLANVLEQATGRMRPPGQPRNRAWWRLRLLPLLACIIPAGKTLARGQVNIILLVLICGFIAAALNRRAFRAGVCLAGAICLKVIPAFLLIVPLWRRDLRCLASCAVGLAVIGLLVPVLGLGMQETLDDYCLLASGVLGPGLGLNESSHVDDELTDITCGHSQSPMSVIHVWLHPERSTRPTEIPAWTRGLHWFIGGLLVLLTLWAGRDLCPLIRDRFATRKQPSTPGQMPEGVRFTLFTGLLMIAMLLISPMCHSHYLCLAIPTLTALMAWDWQNRVDDNLSLGLTGLMVVYFTATLIAALPGMVLIEDGGMGGFAMLLVWLVGLLTLWQTRPAPTTGESAAPAARSGHDHVPNFGRRHGSPSTSLRTSSET